jgi:hypothetical protein
VTMSSPFSFEYLADIRDGARRMVERSRAHEGDLNQLVETAEGTARHAAALALALARADTNTDGLSRLCSDQARLSAANAAATVRACVGAREQHGEAHRLYRTIDSGPAPSDEMLASHAAAVLVVDDVEDVRDLVALVLRNAGFVVRTAVNGLEGLLTAYEMSGRDCDGPHDACAERARGHAPPQVNGSDSTIASDRLHRKRLDPAAARAVVRRCRVKAVAAGHGPRGCSERSQSVATAHAV